MTPYAHAQGVIHRDLKPANVMVGGFGEVQVMDWGLAKVLGERPRVSGPSDDPTPGDDPQRTGAYIAADALVREGQTQAGAVMGTPAYMPPEQARGETAAVDARSDVFGLGAVLCVVLTGRPPFVADAGDSARQMAAQGNLTDAFARLDGC